MRRKKEKALHAKSSALENILFILFLLVFLVTAGILVNWWIEGNKAKKVNEQVIGEVVIPTAPTLTAQEGSFFTIDFGQLQQINKQAVAWIYIPKTNIHYPIVLIY